MPSTAIIWGAIAKIENKIVDCNAIYEECVCRGTPSIGIITNSGLNYDVKLGH